MFLLTFWSLFYIMKNQKGDGKMLKYKINIADALERKGFNTYKAKTTKILSQDTLKKIKNEDTNISLESINRICIILDMQPKDLIEYVEDENEKKKYNFWKIFQNITCQSNIIVIKSNQTKGKDAAEAVR